MPLISKIGARSFKVRLVYGAIFFVLVVGAVTMVYPLLLMLCGSVKSETDINYLGPYPRFWFEDEMLFQKYVESKYNGVVPYAEADLWQTIGSWRQITPPLGDDSEHLADFLAWRGQCPWWWLGHSVGYKLAPRNDQAFRRHMVRRFDGDLDAMARELDSPHTTWRNVHGPGRPGARYPLKKDLLYHRAYFEFADTRPARDRIIENPDGQFWYKHLVPTYTEDIAQYNQKHGTSYDSYHEVFLTRRAPDNPVQRKDWEEFVRDVLSITFIRVSDQLGERYRRFLQKKYESIDVYNQVHGARQLASFDAIEQPVVMPEQRIDQLDYLEFIRDRQACPLDGIEVYGPRQVFEQFVARRRGVPVDQVAPIRLPIVLADWQDCMARKRALRWQFTTLNYRHVLDYILVHGRGIVNTVIYCVLAVGLALLINPVAAYALSRYKPPSTYTVLLFCIATMAFPGEVTMIPAFLLLKRFPLWPLVGGAAAFGLTLWLLGRFKAQMPELLRMTLALAVGIVVGAWAVPVITGKPYVSLLNTFAALVLPGLANGYMIFLLKGFFDSLPRQLYEAADIDGASEWTKFWTLTMSLSKPILAVLALGAFTGAYSAFMMALIIIPDEKMWTIMVWLFQLQHISHQAVVNASLVIAAIPTFLIFLLCQGIIIRGIVVPVDK